MRLGRRYSLCLCSCSLPKTNSRSIVSRVVFFRCRMFRRRQVVEQGEGPSGRLWDKPSLAVRDTCIAAMDRGQFPALATAFLVGMLIYKVPGDSVPLLIEYLTGRTAFIISASGWVATLYFWHWHARSQRRAFDAQSARIIQQNEFLQRSLIDLTSKPQEISSSQGSST